MGKWIKLKLKDVRVETATFNHPKFGEIKKHTIFRDEWQILGKQKRTKVINNNEVDLFYEKGTAVRLKRQRFFKTETNEQIPYTETVELGMDNLNDFLKAL